MLRRKQYFLSFWGVLRQAQDKLRDEESMNTNLLFKR